MSLPMASGTKALTASLTSMSRTLCQIATQKGSSQGHQIALEGEEM